MAGGRIAGITIELNGDATKLTKALADVDKSARQSQNNLKDIDKLLKFKPGNTELLQQKFTNLTTSIESTKQRLETLKEAARQMELGGSANTPEWDALQREIAETEQRLQSLNREMDNFGSVGAQRIAAAGEKVEEVGQKIEGVGNAIMPASVAMIGFGTVAAAKYADVDKVMTLTNQTMGNTAEQAELLESAMAKAASNSTYGMNDAAGATLNFARAGLTAEEAAAALAPAMNLAAGEGGNLDTVSAGLVATINGFGDSFGNAEHYADVFANACNNSALEVNSLSSSMSTAAPVFHAAGYSVNDAALYMGVMANAGIEASEAANALKAGFAQLLPDAKGGAEAMQRFGWSILDGNGKMKDTVTIQKELHEAFAGLSEDQQIAAAQAMFGTNQYSRWLALINTAPEEVSELSEALKEQGSAAEMADSMMSGFGGSIERLKSSVDVLMTMLGKTLAEFLVPIIQKINEFLTWLNSLDAGTRKIIVTIGMLIAAAGPVLIFIGKVTQGVGAVMQLAPKIVTMFGKIKGLITTLGGALQGLWATLMANPIILIIAAIAALVAAFIYFWNTSEEFRNFWINLWNTIKTAVVNAWNAIKSFLTSVWNGIREAATTVFNGVKDFFSNTWNIIKTTAVSAWNGIKSAVTTVWEGMKSTASTVWNGIKDTVSNVTDNVGSTLRGKWDNIKAAYEEHGGGLTGTAAAFMQAVKEKITLGFDIINELTGGKLDGIKALFDQAWDAITNAVMTAWTNIITWLTTAWENITNTITTALEAIKAAITAAWDAILSTISSILSAITSAASASWNTIKSNVTTAMSNIKSFVTSAWNNIKSTVSSVLSAIGSAITSGFNTAKNNVTNALNAIKNTMSNIWNGAVNIVKGAVDKLKSLVSFHWELPKLKLPHFSISGSFSLNPPSVPHLSVQWYKKAMENGMILNDPTIFGMKGNSLLGGGDAGPEAVVGVDSLRSMIGEAVAAATGALAGDIVIPVSIGNQRIDTIVVKAMQRTNYRSGGR